MTPIRVLIVEDEGLIAEDLRDQVEALGHRVVGVAANVTDALARARADAPDVVLMDIRLQGEGDGIDAAAEIANGRTALVFLTAHADVGTVERAMLTRPAAYLTKPVRPAELAAAVRAAAERTAADEQYEAVAAHFRRLVDHATDLVLRLNRNGHLLYANPPARRALGLTEAEVVRRRLFDVVAPDDHDPLAAALVRAQGAADAVPVRFTLHAVDGRPLPVAGVLSGGELSDQSVWVILHPVAADAEAATFGRGTVS